MADQALSGVKRSIVYDPTDENDILASSRNAKRGQHRAIVHPLDPMLPGGSASVMIFYSDGNVDGSTRSYSSELELHSYLEGRMQAYQNEQDRCLTQLTKDLKELEEAEGSPREIKQLRERLESIKQSPIYAFQHVKLGIWQNKGDFEQGRLGQGFVMPDQVYVLPFSSEKVVEEYNNGKSIAGLKVKLESKYGGEVFNLYPVKKMECRAFDTEVREYLPKWKILE